MYPTITCNDMILYYSCTDTRAMFCLCKTGGTDCTIVMTTWHISIFYRAEHRTSTAAASAAMQQQQQQKQHQQHQQTLLYVCTLCTK